MSWISPVNTSPETPNTDTILYVVPPDKQFTSSSLVVCNLRDTPSEFSISIRGSSDDEEGFYIYFEHPVRHTFIATIGMTLGTGNAIFVSGDTTDLSFTLFGVEQAG